MPRRRATRGNCSFCGKDYTRWGMTRHLQTCAERRNAIDSADAGPGRQQRILHLLVEDAWSSDYWLHLEVAGRAALDELDSYLRFIWLECCGHLSHFSVDEIFYVKESELPYAFYESEPMSAQIASVFGPETKAEYLYDYGTSSELLITVAAARTGIWEGKPVRLLSRNETPIMECMVCRKQADWLCLDCLYEDGNCFLCVQHADQNVHDDEMILPAVNSPRIGMCGYEGPAEPPY